jgi:hypothetical protein
LGLLQDSACQPVVLRHGVLAEGAETEAPLKFIIIVRLTVSLQHSRSIDRDGYSVGGNSNQFLVSAHGENLHSAPSMRRCGRWTELKASQLRARPDVVTSHVSGRTTARRNPNDCQRGRGCASRPTQGQNLILCGESSTDGRWGFGGKPRFA